MSRGGVSGREIPWMVRALACPVIPFTKAIQRMEVSGQENIPAAGPVIFVSNHTSHLDAFVTAVALYEQGIPPRFIAKNELFKGPIGMILRSADQIELDRDQPIGTIERMAAVLDRGQSIIIFPEGTFTHDPAGWPMRGKTGIARLHELRPEVPIIPLAHWGNERIIHQWTGRISLSRILRRSERVLVQFGPPLTLTGNTLQDKANSAMTALAHDVAELRNRLGRPMGNPPEARYVPADLHYHLRRAGKTKPARKKR